MPIISISKDDWWKLLKVAKADLNDRTVRGLEITGSLDGWQTFKIIKLDGSETTYLTEGI